MIPGPLEKPLNPIRIRDDKPVGGRINMTQINPEKTALDKEMKSRNLDNSAIGILEKVKTQGKSWRHLSKKYGCGKSRPAMENYIRGDL